MTNKNFYWEKLTVLTYVTSLTVEFCLFLSDTLLLLCAVTVALGVLSSADKRWGQLWTSMHGTSMCVCTGTSCYVTPVCGMFVFGDTMYRLLCLTTGCYENDLESVKHAFEYECLELPLLVFLGMCTMNALHTCIPSLTASFCHRRCVRIVFIGSGWRWDLWMYQSTHYVFIDATL